MWKYNVNRLHQKPQKPVTFRAARPQHLNYIVTGIVYSPPRPGRICCDLWERQAWLSITCTESVLTVQLSWNTIWMLQVKIAITQSANLCLWHVFFIFQAQFWTTCVFNCSLLISCKFFASRSPVSCCCCFATVVKWNALLTIFKVYFCKLEDNLNHRFCRHSSSNISWVFESYDVWSLYLKNKEFLMIFLRLTWTIQLMT